MNPHITCLKEEADRQAMTYEKYAAALNENERLKGEIAALREDSAALSRSIMRVKELEREIEKLRELARASLDAREAEARAASTFRVATETYSTSTPELEAHVRAIIAASKADAALKAALKAVKGEKP